MMVEFETSGDFADIVDGLEAVTLRRPGSSSTSATDKALRGSMSTGEAENSHGEYTLSDLVWHLPDEDLSESPQPGDIIVDAAGDRWTIIAAALTTGGSRWRCVSRNLTIVHALDQYVDIEQAVHEKDDRGALHAVWHTWRTGLAARIQPLATQNTTLHQQDASLQEFRIFLAEWLELDHSHRIKGPDGRVYKINGYKKPERIDALVEIETTRIS